MKTDEKVIVKRMRNLTKEQQKERDAIRTKAMNYATQFIRDKYKDEYRELYIAYLTNRGINYEDKTIIDERVSQ